MNLPVLIECLLFKKLGFVILQAGARIQHEDKLLVQWTSSSNRLNFHPVGQIPLPDALATD